MRIPYAPASPPDPSDARVSAIYQRIQQRRHPRPLIPLDLALLHNPVIADGYNSFVGAVRSSSSFPQDLAELAICYVAVLNGATYEWTSHAPLALKNGASRESLRAVLELGDLEDGKSVPEAVFTADERLVLEFTRQSTRSIKVDAGLFEQIKTRFSDQEVMELGITVGAYNMVSRFLVALDVTESNDKTMEMPPS